MKKRICTFILACVCARASAWTSNDVQLILNNLPAGAVHQFEMVPLRDGVRLATHYFLPSDYQTNAFPAVMMRSAYNNWSQKIAYARRLTDRSDTNNIRWLNATGYVFVVQDLRGDGDSETGTGFEPRLSDSEINDAYDGVEALATNSWCNGRVGMFGGSGHGIAVYNAWFSRAPHLVAVMPDNTAPSLFYNWSFQNGVRRWSYDWLQFRNANDAAMPEWPKPTLGNYYTRTNWNAVLESGAVSNHVILIHDGDRWHNFFLNSSFDVFEHAAVPGNKVFLSVEYGTHGVNRGLMFPSPPGYRQFALLPSLTEILDGAAVTNQSYLEYYVMGDAIRTNAAGNYRRIAQSWPPPSTALSYYMQANGGLTRTEPTQSVASLSYSYHPTNPVPTVGGGFSYGDTDPAGSLNQLVPELTNRTDILRFESAELTAPLEITGKIWAELFIETDVEDTTFMVKLIDIYPQSESNGYQAIMREAAIMARYYGGFTNPAALTTGQVYKLDIDMSTLALLFEEGHRIGVHVTSSSDPAYEVHPNTYNQVSDYSTSPTAHNKVHLSSVYPSRIILPVIWSNKPSIQATSQTLLVTEGTTGTVGVTLSAVPVVPVVVSVARYSGSTDITPSGSTNLLFDETNWTQTQWAAVAALEDGDKLHDTAVIRLSSASPDVTNIVDISVTAPDNDIIPLELTTNAVSFGEGSSGAFGIRLTAPPLTETTVTVTRTAGDSSVTVLANGTNLFSAANWSTWRYAVISAQEDGDATGESATFRVESPDTDLQDVQVQVADNDSAVTLLFDFGTANNTTPGWNNVSTNTVGVKVANAVDTNGAAAGISLSIVSNFNSAVSNGNTSQTGLLYPVSAHGDSFQILTNGVRNGVISLAGLNPAVPYDFVFYGSRGTSANKYSTLYTIQGVSVSNYVAANKTNTAAIAGVYPEPAGNITITVGLAEPDTISGNLSVMELHYASQQTASADTDNDGMPDLWENQYLGTTGASPTNPAANGINTVMECYIAGLDPSNAQSRFLLSELRPLTPATVLRWQGVSGRVYSVYWASNLLSGFQLLMTNIPWTQGGFTDLAHSAESQGFYRIDVRLQQ